ncbi:hypothetical protein MBM_01449 [Drepanopeziza brunnea f. sp. 'multigermtubi' MB_m1]|uniref:Uncharacterized protein n=1 Tax=Marssonina brunnea f. sp. multigermtubi (strain MB_m1) TaxID=1072389 RepID=K1X6N4_MARBU|nr:uncharacterized protein MBM_01449 [Drepanopeziza brunnea f. sp. 'multigermtubi' MB_m1]EKD20767.1 hypothetical protein MBM_01449 [Drepanopeziza brunnea f. sp. 'multigermtubi' MB_m1]
MQTRNSNRPLINQATINQATTERATTDRITTDQKTIDRPPTDRPTQQVPPIPPANLASPSSQPRPAIPPIIMNSDLADEEARIQRAIAEQDERIAAIWRQAEEEGEEKEGGEGEDLADVDTDAEGEESAEGEGSEESGSENGSGSSSGRHRQRESRHVHTERGHLYRTTPFPSPPASPRPPPPPPPPPRLLPSSFALTADDHYNFTRLPATPAYGQDPGRAQSEGAVCAAAAVAAVAASASAAAPRQGRGRGRGQGLSLGAGPGPGPGPGLGQDHGHSHSYGHGHGHGHHQPLPVPIPSRQRISSVSTIRTRLPRPPPSASCPPPPSASSPPPPSTPPSPPPRLRLFLERQQQRWHARWLIWRPRSSHVQILIGAVARVAQALYALAQAALQDVGRDIRDAYYVFGPLGRWVTRGVARLVWFVVKYFYLLVVLGYAGCVGVHQLLTRVPGVRWVSWIGLPAYALVVGGLCAVPLVPSCDRGLFRLCVIYAPPDPAGSRPPAPGAILELNATQAHTLLHDFESLASVEFWDQSLQQATDLEKLGRELRLLRAPYQRLHAYWKWEPDVKLEARYAAAIEPLALVIATLDSSAEDLIVFQYHVSTAYTMIETTLRFFRRRIGTLAPGWYGFRGSAVTAFKTDYAAFATASIDQIDRLIAFIEEIIDLLLRTQTTLDALSGVMQHIARDRLEDYRAQWWWTRLWWSRLHSAYSLEGRDMENVRAASATTIESLTLAQHHLQDRKTRWVEFYNVLDKSTGELDRKGYESLAFQLSVLDAIWTEYRKRSRLASERVTSALLEKEKGRKGGRKEIGAGKVVF